MLLRPAIDVVEESFQQGVAILTIERALLDPDDCPLKCRIDHLVQDGTPRILVDLSRALLLDSSDIGRLIRAHETVRRAGGRIHLCNVQPQVGRLLEITRLDTMFDIHSTRDEGIEALQRNG